MNAPDAHDQIRPILAAGWAALPHDAAAAQRHADQVLAAWPGSADATLLRAAALRRRGEVTAAHACLAPLMTPRPAAPVPWFEWGMLLAAMGEEEQAVRALAQAVHLAPGFTAAWRAMGDALMVLRDGPQAGRAYAQAVRAANRNPALAPAATALCENRAQAVLPMLRDYAARHPQDAGAWHLLGEAELRSGTVDAAEAALHRCLAVAPDLAEARHTLGILFHAQDKHGAAAPYFADLIARAPHNASLRVLLALSLADIGDFAGAIPHHEALLAGHRPQAKVSLMYAHALKAMGREADAIAAYRNCIALAPAWQSGAWLSLADLKTHRFADDDLRAMRAALSLVAPNSLDAAHFHYATGRALEQRAAWAESFTHYATGARIVRATITHDCTELSRFVRASTEVFTRGFFAARRAAASGPGRDTPPGTACGAWGEAACSAGGDVACNAVGDAACSAVDDTHGSRPAVPILIVGMPRSGSTLVEQILASHSAVEGTGELETIGKLARGLRAGRDLASLPETIAGLPPAALAQLGERYLDETQPYRRAGRPYFIDKMPDNFLHAGLIHLMLPNARIIDVRRGAMAAGWAAYKQFFQSRQTGQAYTYDLAEIGRYRRDYVALMAHWREVLPGHVHLVRYERLVEHTEAEIRALLDFCGLAFEPACLRFWETPRAVQTPSAQQVRRPIFRDGLEAWRHYEPWLGPLREALGEEEEE
jgi:tetratricopeptide (TPR) repeat protein